MYYFPLLLAYVLWLLVVYPKFILSASCTVLLFAWTFDDTPDRMYSVCCRLYFPLFLRAREWVLGSIMEISCLGRAVNQLKPTFARFLPYIFIFSVSERLLCHNSIKDHKISSLKSNQLRIFHHSAIIAYEKP
jgi:hypothetical protein